MDTIDIYAVRDGHDPDAYRAPYLSLPATPDVRLGLMLKPYNFSPTPPTFQAAPPEAQQTAWVARVNEEVASSWGVEAGYYFLKNAPDSLAGLKRDRLHEQMPAPND